MISCVSILTKEYSESYTVTSALQQFKVETTIRWLLAIYWDNLHAEIHVKLLEKALYFCWIEAEQHSEVHQFVDTAALAKLELH